MPDNATRAKITLFLEYGPVEIDGPVATELYKEICDVKKVIERNPSQTRYTKEIELSDGSVTSFTMNKLSGYSYHKGSSAEERFSDQINRLNAFVNEHKQNTETL